MTELQDPSLHTTQWSTIVRAQCVDPTRKRAALAELLRRYTRATDRYLGVKRVPPDSSVGDLRNELFTRLLEKDAIQALSPDKGSFRAWLRRCAYNAVADAWRRYKRRCGSEEAMLAFDSVHAMSPGWCFDRTFALDTLDHVLDTLAAQYSGSPDEFAILKNFLPSSRLSLECYAPAAEALGISPAAARQRVRALRERYGELLERAVTSYLDVDTSCADWKAQVQCEMGHLYRALCEDPEVTSVRAEVVS